MEKLKKFAKGVGIFFLVVIVIGALASNSEETIEEKVEEKPKEEVIEEKKVAKEKAPSAKEEHEAKIAEATELWQGGIHEQMVQHYSDVGVLNIKADSGMSVFYVIVPNTFKLSSENEKLYYVEELAPLIKNDVKVFLGVDVNLVFLYEDNSEMATFKITGGYKIKK